MKRYWTSPELGSVSIRQKKQNQQVKKIAKIFLKQLIKKIKTNRYQLKKSKCFTITYASNASLGLN